MSTIEPHAATLETIFVSYSRQDADFARGLYTELHTLGFKLWRDRSEMEGGLDWWQQIVGAIKGSNTMVLCLSNTALASAVVRREWRTARQEGRRVIPVVARDVDFSNVPRWMGKVHWYDFRHRANDPEHELQWQAFLRQLNMPEKPARVPFMVEDLPDDFVARDREFEALKALLLNENREPVAITAALRGAGGYGKTTLARALCHDEDIQDAFSDGILWVTLGEKPAPAIGQLADLIEILVNQRPGFSDIEAARTRLREVLAERDVLLVVDDVWQPEHARPFSDLGPSCAVLMTTRNADTLPKSAQKINVDGMEQGEAAALLGAGLLDSGDSALSSTRTQYMVSLRALAGKLGEWPLLLKLVNGVLRDRVLEYGQTLAEALEYVNAVWDEDGITGFDAEDAEDRNRAVAASLGLSLERLTDEQHKAYMKLAIFPEDALVPLVTLERLWELKPLATERLCERLSKLSLLLDFDVKVRTIQLHDVIRQYLMDTSDYTALKALHGRFLDSYGVKAWADLAEDEPYLWDTLAMHLQAAGREDELVATAKDLHYVVNKTWLRSAYAVEQDLGQALEVAQEDGALRTLKRAYGNMVHWLNESEALSEVASILHSRVHHFPELANAVKTSEAALPRPFLGGWHPLPDLPHPALIRTLRGHSKAVMRSVVSPDGHFIVSASWDNTLKVWEVESGALHLTLHGHSRPVRGCAMSPDSRFIVSASQDKTLKVWETESGGLRHTLEGHTSWVTGCAVSPDGRFIVSASRDNTLKLWELERGALIRTLQGHVAGLWGCAISPDGRFVVSASWDTTLKVWEIRNGTLVYTLRGHSAGVNDCAVSPDGKWIVSASADKTLKIWETESGILRYTLEGHSDLVNGCTVTPDGRCVISASRDKTLKVWDAASGILICTLKGHLASVNDCTVSPDGRWIISVAGDAIFNRDSTLKIWQNESKEVLHYVQKGHSGSVGGCAISSDGRFVISASLDKTLKVWDATNGILIRTLEGHSGSVYRCAISPDSRYLVSASEDKTLKVWDATSSILIRTLEGHSGSVYGCAISPDGRYIVSASADKTLKIWETESGILRYTLEGHSGSVGGCAISPDGRYIVSASADKTLKIWDAIRGILIRTLEGHSSWVNRCTFSPDGRYVVSTSGSLPDNSLIVKAENFPGLDNTLKVWQLENGALIHVLEGHLSWVYGCAMTPDGGLGLSVSQDQTVRVWAMADGRCLAVLPVDGVLRDCAWHPDGEHLVAVGEKGVYFLRFVQ